MPNILIQKLDENRAIAGIGSGILMKNKNGKFSVLALTDKVPSVKGETESIETPNTMSGEVTMIAGITKLEKVSFDVYDHRDNRRKFAKLSGQILDFITFGNDRVGERFTGTVTYKVGERENGNATKATVTITPSHYVGDVDDITPLYQPIAWFMNVPAMIDIDAATKKYELDIEIDPTTATVAAVSETTSIATATIAANKLTITGVAKGSCVVVLTATGSDIATNETTILVDVPTIASN